MNPTHDFWLREAIAVAQAGVAANRGGPFGAIVVRDGALLARGENRVLETNDPTAHAEIVAIRLACQHFGAFHLPGAIVYSSCEPCPMCLAALYWARVEQVFYAATASDAASAGFADAWIRDELPLPHSQRSLGVQQLASSEALAPFEAWQAKPDKVPY
jgi:tRNA(Arg) A34 adenosine deaminase TadA